jgi:aminocarboxymuconate-semialdehyde decarboxylase
MPRRYFDRMCEVVSPSHYMQKRTRAIPVLTDLDLRFRIMDRYEGYVQVLTLANPPIEVAGSPDVSPELAQLANDGMAEIVAKYPERFPGFVASLPMNNPDAAVREIDRAIDDLHATGVQIYTNVAGGRSTRRSTARLRSNGAERPADLDAPGPARGLRRLRG